MEDVIEPVSCSYPGHVDKGSSDVSKTLETPLRTSQKGGRVDRSGIISVIANVNAMV
jgi:hypothetical protein